MELAEKINMPYSTLARTTNELVKKDIMSLQKIASGKQEMQFNFERYNQGIVRVLLNHEERLDETEIKMQQMASELDSLRKEIAQMKKEKNVDETIIL
jgi:TolA-binding protein